MVEIDYAEIGVSECTTTKGIKVEEDDFDGLPVLLEFAFELAEFILAKRSSRYRIASALKRRIKLNFLVVRTFFSPHQN